MSHYSKKLMAAVLFICLATVPALAQTTGVGGPYGEYSMAYPGPETLTLLVLPDGGGDPFDRAFLPYGGRADATITLILRDANYDPVPGFPREDIWLISTDQGLAACAGGAIPDSNTDAAGMTAWTSPLRAGGNSQAPTEVRVNGSPLELGGRVSLSYNSPDINGDLVVNLTDVQIFTGDFYTGYEFRSDFFRDGVVNLSDVAEIAQAVGATCP